MGCDIHLFVEYREGGEWRFLGRFHPGRDYRAFGAIAGVRHDGPPVVKPRGLPGDATFEAWLANMSIRSGDEVLDEDAMARLRLGRMVGADVSHLVSPSADWHSHSWLDAEELAQAIEQCSEGQPNTRMAWRALAALLAALPSGRMVFFFDN